ncbi:putative transcription factor interactor and regulator CCHC(Zn) family [Helianthus debilis subsp. tardiflorus]
MIILERLCWFVRHRLNDGYSLQNQPPITVMYVMYIFVLPGTFTCTKTISHSNCPFISNCILLFPVYHNMNPNTQVSSAAHFNDTQQSGIRATECEEDLKPTSTMMPCKHCIDEKKEQRRTSLLQRRCYYCNEPEHQILSCKTKENDEATQLIRLAINTRIQQQESVEDHKLEFIVTGTDGGLWSEIWYVSTYFKHHYAGNLDAFKRIKNVNGVETNAGENNFFFIRGIGAVDVTSGSEKFRIQSVFYTPELDQNTLS